MKAVSNLSPRLGAIHGVIRVLESTTRMNANHCGTKPLDQKSRAITTGIEQVLVSNLRVSVTIRGIGEFQRDEGLAFREVISPSVRDDVAYQVIADQTGKELVEHGLLIRPLELA